MVMLLVLSLVVFLLLFLLLSSLWGSTVTVSTLSNVSQMTLKFIVIDTFPVKQTLKLKSCFTRPVVGLKVADSEHPLSVSVTLLVT